MITLTEEQANEIVRRMDMAIRAGGALAAEPLMPIIIDWRQQAQKAQQEPNDRQVEQPPPDVMNIATLLNRIEISIQDAKMQGCGDQLDEQLRQHGYVSLDTVAAALSLDRDDIEEAIDGHGSTP